MQLSEYRQWLESEEALLGNSSRHAYAFGQANMAKRAIERLDEALKGNVLLAMSRREALAVLTALEMLERREAALDPSLAALLELLRTETG
jgi:hypothetical protein